ncbi:SGNH/GDSL hydrolase family protein [Micromonosporaceae bacterium Da 78-11]
MQPSFTLVRRLALTGLAALLTAGGLLVDPGRSAAGVRPADPSAAQDLAAGLPATPSSPSPSASASALGSASPSTPASPSAPGEPAVGTILGAPLRVMPLGDSLTWGKGSTDGSGYRVALQSRLTVAGLETDFVGSQRNGSGPDLEHEGHPGWRIAQIDANIDQWVPAAAPDLILLDIGTNDLLHHEAVDEAPARLAALIDRLIVLAPDARIVLAKLLVVRPGFRRFNAALTRIAADRPEHVWLADMSGISPDETVDRVHPTDLGYREMAAEWYRALRPIVPGGETWTFDPNPLPAN